MHANVLSSILNSSLSSRHVRKVLQASHLFTNIHGYHKQIPTDTSLTASTNVISMQYPNTILNTKMTLPQLVGPIDVVSPEHSSGDRSHEFQIASSKNASIEFSKAEYARPTKAELAHCTTSSRSSKYAQSQKLSSLTSQKYRIFPQEEAWFGVSIHFLGAFHPLFWAFQLQPVALISHVLASYEHLCRAIDRLWYG